MKNRSNPKIEIVTKLFLDFCIWIISFQVAIFVRLDFRHSIEFSTRSFELSIVAFVFFRLFLFLDAKKFGQYRTSSLDEFESYFRAGALLILVLTLFVNFFRGEYLPRSLPLIGVTFSLSLALVLRLYNRRVKNKGLSKSPKRPTLIYGAGDIGEQIIRQMQHVKNVNYWPIGIIEDDVSKKNFKINGVPVLGNLDALGRILKKLKVDSIFVAISQISSDKLQRLQLECKNFGIDVRIVSTLAHLNGPEISISDFQEIQISDLLGRNVAVIGTSLGRESLLGKKILVTGGGGSIGSEICIQLSRFNPKSIGILDRDETGILNVLQDLSLTAPKIKPAVFLGDIRDLARLKEVFTEFRPDVVFHAAALKHLNFLENAPDEAFKTNVCGTLNVLRVSRENRVERFVNISTDKAADPISVLGVSKLMTERLTANLQEASDRSTPKYISVRFGNVFGSRGSAIYTFEKQILSGGPVKITHLEVERYFMTIEEAVALVLEAGDFGDTGDVMILEMGQSVKIMDLVQKLLKILGVGNMEISFTGLGKGEKLREVLIGDNEKPFPTMNSKVFKVVAEPIDWNEDSLKSEFYSMIQELKSGE